MSLPEGVTQELFDAFDQALCDNNAEKIVAILKECDAAQKAGLLGRRRSDPPQSLCKEETDADEPTLRAVTSSSSSGNVAISCPVFTAADAGACEVLELLLQLGCDPNVGPDGPLISPTINFATEKEKKAKTSATSSSSLSEKNEMRSMPIHAAFRHNDDVAAALLLAAGADPHAVDRDGRSIAHYAAENGAVVLLEYVMANEYHTVKSGNSPDKNSDKKENSGKTATSKMADTIACDPLELCLAVNEFGQTPLHTVCADIVRGGQKFVDTALLILATIQGQGPAAPTATDSAAARLAATSPARARSSRDQLDADTEEPGSKMSASGAQNASEILATLTELQKAILVNLRDVNGDTALSILAEIPSGDYAADKRVATTSKVLLDFGAISDHPLKCVGIAAKPKSSLVPLLLAADATLAASSSTASSSASAGNVLSVSSLMHATQALEKKSEGSESVDFSNVGTSAAAGRLESALHIAALVGNAVLVREAMAHMEHADKSSTSTKEKPSSLSDDVKGQNQSSVQEQFKKDNRCAVAVALKNGLTGDSVLHSACASGSAATVESLRLGTGPASAALPALWAAKNDSGESPLTLAAKASKGSSDSDTGKAMRAVLSSVNAPVDLIDKAFKKAAEVAAAKGTSNTNNNTASSAAAKRGASTSTASADCKTDPDAPTAPGDYSGAGENTVKRASMSSVLLVVFVFVTFVVPLFWQIWADRNKLQDK